MNTKEFCFWPKGYFDLAELNRKKDSTGLVPAVEITQKQLHLIRTHLDSVEELKK